MRLILTALIMIIGIFDCMLGIGFLILPMETARSFGLAAAHNGGLSTMRADMTAFFLVAGITMIWGAWKRSGTVLLVPAALFLIALFGRLVSLFADGPYDGFLMPMVIEAITVAIVLMAARMLPHRLPQGG
ncbi:DUF4345 family protein [Altericroceibacterium endophyticum]|uniref:DUF4345 domain-containing protein n=1 Tax=Altericroceibacterium endophyticum TaxID=1808508 RepID=A0A6I4T428_9SPHN|nr:hypothetical protein [Altericroceibacterium endophyticum]MXO65089.1 hypothetical protein [Altericroceibacterium endophyticum]